MNVVDAFLNKWKDAKKEEEAERITIYKRVLLAYLGGTTLAELLAHSLEMTVKLPPTPVGFGAAVYLTSSYGRILDLAFPISSKMGTKSGEVVSVIPPGIKGQKIDPSAVEKARERWMVRQGEAMKALKEDVAADKQSLLDALAATDNVMEASKCARGLEEHGMAPSVLMGEWYEKKERLREYKKSLDEYEERLIQHRNYSAGLVKTNEDILEKRGVTPYDCYALYYSPGPGEPLLCDLVKSHKPNGKWYTVIGTGYDAPCPAFLRQYNHISHIDDNVEGPIIQTWLERYGVVVDHLPWVGPNITGLLELGTNEPDPGFDIDEVDMRQVRKNVFGKESPPIPEDVNAILLSAVRPLPRYDTDVSSLSFCYKEDSTCP